MRYFELFLTESYSDYPNVWVHYSDIPMAKMNPKSSHSDPVALYFFPRDFKPVSYWTKKKYKFTAILKPGAKVLDLATVSDDEMDQFLKDAGAWEEFAAYVEMYPPETHEKRVDMAWEQLQRHYGFSSGQGKRTAAFNKLFRAAGYDAIFDDTKSIHSSETQLVVLNPAAIRIVDMELRKTGMFTHVEKAMNIVADMASEFGPVKVEKPRTVKDRWSGAKKLEASVRVGDEDRYIVFRIEPADDGSFVSASVRYARPSLNAGYGGRFDVTEGDFEEYGRKEIQRALEKVFAKKLAVAEEKNWEKEAKKAVPGTDAWFRLWLSKPYLTNGIVNESTTTLRDLYGDDILYDEDELISHFIGKSDLDVALNIREIPAQKVKALLTSRGDMTVVDAFEEMAEPAQKKIVAAKKKKFDSERVIVVQKDRVIDGNHHVVAAAQLNKPVKAIDLDDLFGET